MAGISFFDFYCDFWGGMVLARRRLGHDVRIVVRFNRARRRGRRCKRLLDVFIQQGLALRLGEVSLHRQRSRVGRAELFPWGHFASM
jgi:hypothetical protein